MLTSDLRAVPPASLCTKEGPSAQGWQVRCCGASPVLTMNLSKWRQCPSPLRQGGEATGSHPPELRGQRGRQVRPGRGEPGPRLAGSGTDSHRSLEAERGPPRALTDPRPHPQAPHQLPKAEQQGSNPCVRRGREEGPFRDLLSGAELGAQVPELEPDPRPWGSLELGL